jgi:hypothetical protein
MNLKERRVSSSAVALLLPGEGGNRAWEQSVQRHSNHAKQENANTLAMRKNWQLFSEGTKSITWIGHAQNPVALSVYTRVGINRGRSRRPTGHVILDFIYIELT